jgi:hypothetical protein
MTDTAQAIGGSFAIGTTGTSGDGGATQAQGLVTPFTTAKKGAALRRMKQAQAAMGKTLTLAQAAEKGWEEARKKKEEEEAAAAAAKAAAKALEKENEMDLEEDEDEEGKEGKEDGAEDMEDDDESSLGEVARNLEKETESGSNGKKRRATEVSQAKTGSSGTRKTYAAATTATTALRPSSFVPHTHLHKRVIIEASARLTSEDKAKEFVEMVGTLITNARIVDNFFVIVPVIMGSGRKDLKDAKDVPTNMTTLGAYVKISEKSLKVFELKNPFQGKVKGKKTAGGGETMYNNDMVYFTFAIDCDVEPTVILPGISVEWMRVGGVGLYRKEIQAFNTFSPFVIFYLYNGISVHTIMAEFKRMMEEAIKLLEDEAMVDDQARITRVPPFAFRKSLPKLPGSDPEEYAGLKPRQAANRRAWHLEMETQHLETFNRLIEQCKDVLIFDSVWGEHVLISRVVEYDSPPGDIKRVLKTAKRHTSFQVSMTVVQLYGISDIDATATFVEPMEGEEDAGVLTLRFVMLRHFRTRDGLSPLFAEIHQKQSGGVVEAVVPNTKEAEAMVGSMNRQMPAFLKHYLLYKGLPADFVTRMVVAACCPTLVAEINTVTWDSEALDLTTAEDTAVDSRLSAFEKASWFIDIDNLRVSPKKKKQYTAPEALFLLDETRSVTTLHAKNDGKRTAAREGAFDVDSEEEVDDLDSASDERDHDKSSQDLDPDKAAGDNGKTITWSPASSSDERLASREAAGSG